MFSCFGRSSRKKTKEHSESDITDVSHRKAQKGQVRRRPTQGGRRDAEESFEHNTDCVNATTCRVPRLLVHNGTPMGSWYTCSIGRTQPALVWLLQCASLKEDPCLLAQAHHQP
eukprot:scaffold98505_cov17-Tisochrysis_lutea.AAC.1